MNDLRIVGTGNQEGATIQALTLVNADGTIGAAIPGATAVVGPIDSVTGVGADSIRLLSGSPANPGQVYVKSSGGDTAGPRTVFNG